MVRQRAWRRQTILFSKFKLCAEEQLGVEMLYGAEVNILDENGSLDHGGIRSSHHLDYVIASIHKPVKKTRDKRREHKNLSQRHEESFM